MDSEEGDKNDQDQSRSRSESKSRSEWEDEETDGGGYIDKERRHLKYCQGTCCERVEDSPWKTRFPCWIEKEVIGLKEEWNTDTYDEKIDPRTVSNREVHKPEPGYKRCGECMSCKSACIDELFYNREGFEPWKKLLCSRCKINKVDLENSLRKNPNAKPTHRNQCWKRPACERQTKLSDDKYLIEVNKAMKKYSDGERKRPTKYLVKRMPLILTLLNHPYKKKA